MTVIITPFHQGVIDGVIFERIRGRNTVNGIQLNMYYGSDGSEGEREDGQAEGEEADVTSSHTTPVIRNIVIRDVQISTVARDAFLVAGLPEMPITGLVLEDIHIEGAASARANPACVLMTLLQRPNDLGNATLYSLTFSRCLRWVELPPLRPVHVAWRRLRHGPR